MGCCFRQVSSVPNRAPARALGRDLGRGQASRSEPASWAVW
ncbi:hypothetical protein DVDV_2608 [Desulfovibrio sp. DV]|nr:hypothetical protein DVDV_2608 [Desulfovibrio sp. DV]